MSENSFEKNQPETNLEQELKAIEEKHEKLIKEDIRQTNSELIEEAFKLFADNPEELKEAMYLVVNKTSDELVKSVFETMREYQNKDKEKNSASPEKFFDEISTTIH